MGSKEAGIRKGSGRAGPFPLLPILLRLSFSGAVLSFSIKEGTAFCNSADLQNDASQGRQQAPAFRQQPPMPSAVWEAAD
jgi:hypothetical protein